MDQYHGIQYYVSLQINQLLTQWPLDPFHQAPSEIPILNASSGINSSAVLTTTLHTKIRI